MMYLVTGMHKSGTTLVARTLHASGVPMVRKLAEDRGYFEGEKVERDRCRRINERVLSLAPGHSSLRVPRTRAASEGTVGEMEAVVSALEADHAAWGAKDPRFCLTYGAWEPHLPVHRVVAVYRHPVQVWGHYRRDTSKPYALPLLGLAAIRAWILHNLRLLEIADRTDALLIEYDRLMRTDRELERLGAFAGVEIRDVRDAGLYRARETSSRWVETLEGTFGLLYPAGPLELYDRLEARRNEQLE